MNTLTLGSIDINAAIATVETQLKDDKQTSQAMKSAVALLLILVKFLLARLGMNSSNSSKPPASDPLRVRKSRAVSDKPVGGQVGRVGITLKPVEDPDHIEVISIDRRTLPRGHYHDAGFECRQIIELQIERVVTEYRAQILENENGHRFVAQFPAGVTRPAQYGTSVKANAVYMSMFQLIPYERVKTHFTELFDTPISTGTLSNFNREAYERLVDFEVLSIKHLSQASVVHADETGINIEGKRHWLHNASSSDWTLLYPHIKRGQEAMQAMAVLPDFRGTLVHDHWKPYYRYDCTHALCNAHHLRELTFSFEEDGQHWADIMHKLLLAINKEVNAAGGALSEADAAPWRQRYRSVLHQADNECPAPDATEGPPKRGRIKRSKSRNLLERLRDYEEDVLRFMENADVPFTNNQGERDIRMTKVQQKISGCFRSMEGAKVFCRIRSYLSTCRKNGVGAGEALERLFQGKWPEFIQNKLDFSEKGAE